MTIAAINIPVPVSGDGPAVDISNLVGQKTVELTGDFVGQFVLLAGHVAGTLVPVVQFDAGSPEGVQQTLDEAYQFVAVRKRANTTVGSTITMNVSAVTAPGQNFFASLAVINPGPVVPPQPIIDTAALFPPTGLETAINIICVGDFEGPIVVEGSIDGTDFSPIGQFMGYPRGQTLLGVQPPLEFAPLATDDKTRYLRINVGANIKGTTTLTIGGQIPAASSGATVDIGIVTTTTTVYDLQAKAKSSPYTDQAGNTIAVTAPTIPADFTVLGQRNSLTFTGTAGLVCLGSDNVVLANLSVILGQSCTIATASNDNIIGQNIVIHGQTTNHNLVGHSITIWGADSNDTVIGQNVTIGTPTGFGSSYNVVFGLSHTIGDQANDNFVVGRQVAVGDRSNYNVVVDPAGTFGRTLVNCQRDVILGNFNIVGDNVNNSATVGLSNNVAASSSNVFFFGNTIHLNARGSAIYGIGSTITVNAPSTLFQNHCLMGTQLYLENANSPSTFCASTVMIGDSISVVASQTPATDLLNNVAIGSAIVAVTRFSTDGSDLILIGTTLLSGNNDGSGAGTDHNVIVGANLTASDDTSFNVLIGNATTIGTASLYNNVIGTNTVGATVTYNTVVGYTNNLHDKTSFTVLIGNNNNLNGSPTLGIGNCQLVGSQNVVNAPSLTTSIQNLNIFGSNISATNTLADASLIGKIAAFGSAISLLTTGAVAGTTDLNRVVAVGNQLITTARSYNSNHTSDIVLVGSQLFAGNVDGTGSGVDRCVLVGTQIVSGDKSTQNVFVGSNLATSSGTGNPPTMSVLIGTTNTLTGPNADNCVVIGSNLTLSGLATSVVIGQQITLNSANITRDVIIGSDIAFTDGSFGTGVAIGCLIQVDTAGQGIVVGAYGTIGAGANGVVIGNVAQALPSVANNWCIALGAHAQAAAGQFIVGASSNTLSPNPSIHYFAVNGYNAGNLLTIAATDSPAAGDIGLTVTYNDGVNPVTNKTVQAAATPPVGALLLYVV